jgi:hypothetical protein
LLHEGQLGKGRARFTNLREIVIHQLCGAKKGHNVVLQEYH